MSRIIEVVHYDPVWIAAFEKEAAILNAVFGRRIVEVHHIGSTAVPGLDAKPIIDILVVLDDTDDVNFFNCAMQDVGYRVRGECLDAPIPGTPGRFYFSKEGHFTICYHIDIRQYLSTFQPSKQATSQLVLPCNSLIFPSSLRPESLAPRMPY